MAVDNYLVQLGLVLGASLLNWLGHIFSARMGLSHLKSLVFGFGFGFIIFALGMIVFKWPYDVLALNLCTYSVINYCYFHFVNIGESSVRIRILRELKAQPLSREALYKLYDASKILDTRIERLDSDQQIRIDGPRIYSNNESFLLRLALFFQFLKWLILGRKNHEI